MMDYKDMKYQPETDKRVDALYLKRFTWMSKKDLPEFQKTMQYQWLVLRFRLGDLFGSIWTEFKKHWQFLLFLICLALGTYFAIVTIYNSGYKKGYKNAVDSIKLQDVCEFNGVQGSINGIDFVGCEVIRTQSI